ncbi:phosphatase PAP2 family protein [Mesorhizobium microcysteis]|uniref:Phosphatase PAP2 family protein n=2 Tax=Neoaquamicrobium microcysteis TaxID=2682781 RepID=A0A5D4GQL3_9HYPH|nr:phosphatase PAP2 family protein [Mesorhizobium microcysteis]
MRDTRSALLPVALMALLGAAVFAFLQLADEVGEDELGAIDEALLLLFRDPSDRSQVIGPPWLEETMVEITALGGYPILVVMVAVVVGYLFMMRMAGPALFVLASIVTGTIAGHVLKLVYDRPRPDIVDHLVAIHTPSFPSGHATMSAVVYLTLASLIMRLVDSTLVRGYVLSVAVLLTLAVGISRVYLGVHWPSDVAAGWALGVAWASLSWLVVAALRVYRERAREKAR